MCYALHVSLVILVLNIQLWEFIKNKNLCQELIFISNISNACSTSSIVNQPPTSSYISNHNRISSAFTRLNFFVFLISFVVKSGVNPDIFKPHSPSRMKHYFSISYINQHFTHFSIISSLTES